MLQGILKDADFPPNEGRVMPMLHSKYDMHTESTEFQVGKSATIGLAVRLNQCDRLRSSLSPSLLLFTNC